MYAHNIGRSQAKLENYLRFLRSIVFKVGPDMFRHDSLELTSDPLIGKISVLTKPQAELIDMAFFGWVKLVRRDELQTQIAQDLQKSGSQDVLGPAALAG